MVIMGVFVGSGVASRICEAILGDALTDCNIKHPCITSNDTICQTPIMVSTLDLPPYVDLIGGKEFLKNLSLWFL